MKSVIKVENIDIIVDGRKIVEKLLSSMDWSQKYMTIAKRMKTEINLDEEIKNPKGVIRVDEEFISSEDIELVNDAMCLRHHLGLDEIPFKIIVTKDGLKFKTDFKNETK